MQMPKLSAFAGRRLSAITGVFLFSATAAFVLWQNAHLTVLWDLSYILENASRIALGQLPYRDFPFPYAPLTFFIQAAIIKLAGHAVWHHYLYAACGAGAASLLTWRILLLLLSASRLPARLLAFLLAAPLVFLGTSSIFPHPFYDADCTLLILFCLWTLLKLEEKGFPPRLTFLCGALLVFPPLTKQNTGLAFLLSAVACIAWLALRNSGAPYLPSFGRCGLVLAGAVIGCVLAVAALHFTVGLHNYLLWTVHFAASRRLPALSNIVEIYRDPALIAGYLTFAAGAALWLLLPASRRKLRWLAAALLCYPFAEALSGLVRLEDPADRVEPLLHLWPVLLLAATVAALVQLWRAHSVAQILPAILLGSIHGAFLSQQLWGSTYALWPLLAILIAVILAALAETNSTRPLIVFALLASVVLGITGGYYALSHERLSYVDLDGELHHSRRPSLRGLAIAGDWLPDFEELSDYAAREIPREDAILSIPGEDLFYFTTGRTPRFPVVMMDHTVNPYSAAELASLARQRNVRWVIVKRRLQLQEEPIPFRAQLLEELSRNFVPAAELNNYDIYRRKE
jgi:hypothetical protein